MSHIVSHWYSEMGILKLSDLDSLTIFILGGGGYSETENCKILKCQDLPKFQFSEGGILKLSDLDSLTIFIFRGGGGTLYQVQNRGIL